LAEKGDGDMGKIIDPFLQLLEQHHSAFRHLCFFKPSMLEEGKEEQLKMFLTRLSTTIADESKKQSAQSDFKPWLKEYAARITAERGLWEGRTAGSWEDARCTAMRRWNPRFVLRQWVLEETISKLEHGEGLDRRKVLDQIMQVSAVSLYWLT
jgi:serine/tyrosine/threonine adenylyltransferase